MCYGSRIDDARCHMPSWYYTGYAVAEVGRLDLVISPRCVFPTVSNAKQFLEGALDGAASVNCHRIVDYIIAHFMGRLCPTSIGSACAIARVRRYTDMCAKVCRVRYALREAKKLLRYGSSDVIAECLRGCVSKVPHEIYIYKKFLSAFESVGLNSANYAGIWAIDDVLSLPENWLKSTSFLCKKEHSKVYRLEF